MHPVRRIGRTLMNGFIVPSVYEAGSLGRDLARGITSLITGRQRSGSLHLTAQIGYLGLEGALSVTLRQTAPVATSIRTAPCPSEPWDAYATWEEPRTHASADADEISAYFSERPEPEQDLQDLLVFDGPGGSQARSGRDFLGLYARLEAATSVGIDALETGARYLNANENYAQGRLNAAAKRTMELKADRLSHVAYALSDARAKGLDARSARSAARNALEQRGLGVSERTLDTYLAEIGSWSDEAQENERAA